MNTDNKLFIDFKTLHFNFSSSIIDSNDFEEQEQYGVYGSSNYTPINALFKLEMFKKYRLKTERIIFKYYRLYRYHCESDFSSLTPTRSYLLKEHLEPVTAIRQVKFYLKVKGEFQFYTFFAGSMYYWNENKDYWELIGSLCLNKGYKEKEGYVDYKNTTFILDNKILLDKNFSIFYKRFLDYYLNLYVNKGGNILFVNSVVDTIYDCPFKIKPSPILLDNIKSSRTVPMKLLLKDFDSFKTEPPPIIDEDIFDDLP